MQFQSESQQTWETCSLCIFPLLIHVLHCPIRFRLKKNISSKIKVLKFQDDVNRVLNHMYMYEVDLAIRTTIFKMETFP